jgi:hypothetical protein
MPNCPTIPNLATNDTTYCGATYTKSYWLTDWTWASGTLTPPVTFEITGGPGGSLSDSILWNSSGTLTYYVPEDTPSGTTYNWQITVTDAVGCTAEIYWTTTVNFCEHENATINLGPAPDLCDCFQSECWQKALSDCCQCCCKCEFDSSFSNAFQGKCCCDDQISSYLLKPKKSNKIRIKLVFKPS